MPLKSFICPDGITRDIKLCLDKCPRPEGRCLALPTLHDLSYQRVWTGKASTTMLMNPTRMEWLKIKKDYAIIPQEKAFQLLGTQHHRRLEIVAKKIDQLKAEGKLENETNSSVFDLLEPDDINISMWILTDYKTWGNWQVVKILVPNSYERIHNSLQLNDYRIKAENQYGLKISKMRWQITIRDGGTWVAKKNGVSDKLILVDADKLDNDYVTTYFYDKNKLLMDAINNDKMPLLCDFEERWKGKRCIGSLCEVHPFCPEGAKINKVEYKG